MSNRKHNAAAEAVLFAVSTRCAYPDCRIPTVSLTADEKASKNVQAAHIVPVSSSMPRWRKMDPAARDNYPNLILLCTAHHNLVDKSARAHQFTEAMLLQWKHDAEHELREKFDGIDRYTYTEIQTMITLANEKGTNVIMSGIGELGNKVNAGTAKILTVLYQQAADKRRDYEAAAMLHTAAERLTSGDFADTVYALGGAADRLVDFGDTVSELQTATGKLNAFSLDVFMNAVDDASTVVNAIQNAEISTGPDATALARTVAKHVISALDEDGNRQAVSPVPEIPRFDWKHVLLTGIVLGVALSALIIWAVVWLTQRS
ncbi:HNH endonuclease [Saccharopolyspora antimicrobica]|uniref:HNH endonuclease n=1 Tax=Saccharopolyspora antimicrobica TaxID=455193 RepID=A0A1I4VK88_9PSEU|nr:HNH endonuclease signature motif containing protein [Saccharopolyspora antimicrobica]RKT86355.1 HNH endonuclease [Saccharopolyspora antimicrobica]SFN01684.1 HNH endonuclease [Saccharopolyspora antimicrobica]